MGRKYLQIYEARIELKGGVYTIYGKVINLEEDGCLSVSLGDGVFFVGCRKCAKGYILVN